MKTPATGTRMCEAVETVSDADFGYWDEIWGPPDVREFPCFQVATTTVIDEYTGTPVHLCTEHAK